MLYFMYCEEMLICIGDDFLTIMWTVDSLMGHGTVLDGQHTLREKNFGPTNNSC